MGTLEQMAARHIVDVKVLGSSPRRPPKDKQATSFAERLIGDVMKRRRWTNVANISI